MWTVSALLSLLQPFSTAFTKPALPPVPSTQGHLCPAAPATILFLRSDTGTRDFMLSLEHTQLHHPGDGSDCCNARLCQVKCSTPSLPFHPQRQKNTLPCSRTENQTADHVAYLPLASLYPPAGINASALPLYRVSAFSTASCFLAAALR